MSELTERDWFSPIGFQRALSHVRGNLSPRRERLLAVACCRLFPQFVDNAELRQIVSDAERMADGAPPTQVYCDQNVYCLFGPWPNVLVTVRLLDRLNRRNRVQKATRRHQPGGDLAYLCLLREIVGNPFRSNTFERHWRTADTLGLARGIYEDRAFDRMPLLADALMDAGCADDKIISHCRTGGPHVRGCWLVDLVLGKE
jgi:hypothetical protein